MLKPSFAFETPSERRDNALDLFSLAAATIALAVAALLAGCSGELAVSSSTEAAATSPVLQFHSDWSVTQSAPLVGGGSAIVRYAIDRLPDCRAIYHGGPAWGMTANWFADGGFARNTAVVNYVGGANVPVEPTIQIPFGRDLAMWFHNSDVGGCSRYDSNYGRNFHFAIQAPPEPVLHFLANWTTPVDGAPRAGADFLVDYDLIRLPQCRALYNGYAAWDITAHARFSDGSLQHQAVTGPVGLYGRDRAPARFSAPGGARSVELWFENTDRSGCRAWDSNFGRNFRFDLN